LQRKYKEKIEQYKKKLSEYKDRLDQKEQALQDFNRKNEEDRIINEKNIEILQLRMQEQRETYEHKIILIEEEYHKKMVYY
jgi:hypothetical protein